MKFYIRLTNLFNNYQLLRRYPHPKLILLLRQMLLIENNVFANMLMLKSPSVLNMDKKIHIWFSHVLL